MLLPVAMMIAAPFPGPAARAGEAAEPQLIEVAGDNRRLVLETVTDALVFPWSIAFLPDGDMLVTEKHPGNLRRVSPDGVVSPPVAGVPDVAPVGNGGLLGLALDPAFADNGMIYLAYSEPGADGTSGLSVARARLEGDRLSDVTVIFRETRKFTDDRNFGGRIVFAPDGTLYIFTGDRFAQNLPRDPSSTIGKILRINTDGTIPPDNPFVGKAGYHPAVVSMGHRNPGGAAFHPETGQLFMAEFGPWGGDELILPQFGDDHGWPDVSWGAHYTQEDIPDPPTRPDLDREIFFWSPTIGPSGMVFVSADEAEPRPGEIPNWHGTLLIGALTRQSLLRLTVEGDRVLSEERLPIGARVRDVIQGPDGAIYLLTEGDRGAILRLSREAD